MIFRFSFKAVTIHSLAFEGSPISRSPGRQEIRVTARLDDDHPNTGWYEATGEGALPLYHRSYFGPGIVLNAFGLGLVLNLGLWITGYVAFRLYRRRRRS